MAGKRVGGRFPVAAGNLLAVKRNGISPIPHKVWGVVCDGERERAYVLVLIPFFVLKVNNYL